MKTSQGPLFPENHGFTLVELLTTLVIIGLLSALLVPSVRKVMDVANGGKCISNLRQIGIAANLFANDNNNFYPAAWESTVGINFMHFLQPYLEQDFSNPKGIFMCPSAAQIRDLTYGTYGERAGYAMNLVLSNSSDRPGVPRQRINHASRVILFADVCQAWPDGGDVAFWEPVQMYNQILPLDAIADIGPDNDKIWSANGWMRYRHNGGVNAVMVDGHVENLKKGTVTVGNLAADR